MLPSCPIWLTTLLTAGGKPLNNILWQHKDVFTTGQLCNENGVRPFSDVKAEAAFLADLQIKSITSKFTLAHKTELDNNLMSAITKRGTTSSIYKILLLASPNPFITTQQAWEKDLGVSLTPEQWNAIWKKGIVTSRCVRYRIIQFKILCRAYITPSRISKINKDLSDQGWHNCGGHGSLLHLLWDSQNILAWHNKGANRYV